MKNLIFFLLIFNFFSCNRVDLTKQNKLLDIHAEESASIVDSNLLIKGNYFFLIISQTDTIKDDFFDKMINNGIYPSDLLRLDMMDNVEYEESVILLFLKMYKYSDPNSLFIGDIENRINENSYWLLMSSKYYKIFNKKPSGQLLLSSVINEIVTNYKTENTELNNLILSIKH